MAESAGNVRVFCRIKPSKNSSGLFAVADEGRQLEFSLPVDAETINNTRTSYKFRFDHVFGENATQEDVFDAVAKDAVDSALEGYNATIFAYGQTGSGKTFTITGGAERYADRGIIPRTLSRIFAAFKSRTDMHYNAYVSYLELYNEKGYDLLDPSHESKTLEELPRVTLMEDEDGAVHLKNLSMHLAANEEEALNLLFLGDTNRAIAETPMNMASSRSHCIFTVSVEARQEGSSTIRRSKLHLVDLAGSERVHKTHASGQLLREALHINKSLHFLEMVIVALQDAKKTGRGFVPYRNSMMTSVLRDSLGGNCKTSMIATIASEPDHTAESISTCHFAQRVARVQNSAIVNEETDPNVLIRQLKSKLTNLSAELSFLKTGPSAGKELTDADRDALLTAAKAYVSGSADATFDLGEFTLNRVHAAFHAIRQVALDRGGTGRPSDAATEEGGSASAAAAPAPSATIAAAPDASAVAGLRDELHRLKAQLQQRDNEIAILVNMVKSTRAANNAPPPSTGGAPNYSPAAAAPVVTASAAPLPAAAPQQVADERAAAGLSVASARPASGTPLPAVVALPDGSTVSETVLQDRGAAFDAFRQTYTKTEIIEENKRVLKEKYDLAKVTAEQVNSARAETNRLKADIERRRVERAMASLVDGAESKDADGADGSDAVERELRDAMEAQKIAYKDAFQRLRDLKSEIEQIQRTLEGNRVKMQADFELWYSAAQTRLQEAQQAPSTAPSRALAAPAPSPAAPPAWASMPAGMPSPAGPYMYMGSHPTPQLMPGQVALQPLMTPYMYPAPVPGMPMMMPPPGWPGAPWGAVPATAGSMGPRDTTPHVPASTSMPAHATSAASTPGAPALTGNPSTDADILAFYRAKDELLRRTRSSGGMTTAQPPQPARPSTNPSSVGAAAAMPPASQALARPPTGLPGGSLLSADVLADASRITAMMAAKK